MHDPEIQRAVLAALRADERLSSQPIDAHSERGHLVLSGRVQSYRRKLAAHEVAATVPGVAHVENRIEVCPPATRSDEDVAEDVRALLEGEETLVKEAVIVEVRAGRVTLSGSVTAEAERILAADVVLQAPGTREVLNHLTVEPAARLEAAAVARELDLALRNDDSLAGCEFRLAISGSLALLSGTARTRAQIERAVELISRTWIGAIRQEVTLE